MKGHTETKGRNGTKRENKGNETYERQSAPTLDFFLYSWPEVSSISWPTHVKSMSKISTRYLFSASEHLIHSEWCCFRSSVMNQVTVFTGDPQKVIWGRLSSPTDFLQITFDSEEIETWEWSYCVSLIKTHLLICNMTYLGHHVTSTWDQILTLAFQDYTIHV